MPILGDLKLGIPNIGFQILQSKYSSHNGKKMCQFHEVASKPLTYHSDTFQAKITCSVPYKCHPNLLRVMLKARFLLRSNDFRL